MTPELEGLICTLLDGGDNLVSGDTMTADVVGPGGVLDGIDDVTITYTEYTSGGATAAATCDGAGAVSVGASSSGANAGDFAFFNICIEFLPGAVVSAANLADFSLSSANGASVEYEFGLIEVTPRGMPKTVTSAALGAYNVNDYPGNGGANTLLHDLFTPAQQEGIGFFTDEAVDITLGPCGVGATCGAGNCEYTSSTGIPSGGQHYVANAVGGAINNFYTTAAAQAAVTDVGAISFWYGIFDVNDCSSSSPGGSMTADEQTVCVPPPPCTIEAVTVSDPMCLGNDASFDVSFNVTNGGGTYNVVAATADAVNGITAGQILATGAASPITVTLTGPTAAGSFDVNVEDTTAFDAAGNICSGTAVTVSIPVCEIPPNPCISLSKEADLVGALAGDTVTYTLIATNCGEALLTNVILTDALLGATLSAPTSIAGDANVANGMDTNEAWQWTATYVVMQADVDSGMQLVNTAGVTADSSAGPVDDMAEAVVCVSPSCTKSTGACFIEIDFDEPAFADVLGAPITEGGEGAVAGEEVQSPTGDPFNWTYGFNVIEDGTCNEWDAATYAGRPATDADDIFITYTAINQTPLPTVAGAPMAQEVRSVVTYNTTSGGRLTFLKRISNPGDADQDVFIQPGSLYGGQVTVTFGPHIQVVAEDPKNPANRTNFRQSSSYTSTDYWEHGIGSFVGDAFAARPSNQGYLFTECNPPVVPGQTTGTSTVTPGYTTPAPTGIWYIDNCVLNTETQCGDLNHPLGENAGSGNSVDPNGTIFASAGPGTLNGGPCGPVSDNAGMAANAVVSAISFMGVQEVSEPYNGPENPNAVPEDNGNFFGYETQNSGGIISFQSFCFVVNQPEACLGLAKEVEPVECPAADGTVDLNYTLRVCNEGNCADLDRVQIVEDLLQYIPAGQINAVSAPVLAVPPATGTLTLDPAFDGQTNIRILDELASDLPFGECAEITFTVNVTAPDCETAWTNQAVAWGQGDGACTYDISYDDGTAGSLATTDGANPDFDSSGDGTADTDCPNTDSNETVIALNDTMAPEASCLAGPLQFKIDETGMLTLDLDQVIDVAGISDNCDVATTQIMNNVFDCDNTGDFMVEVTLADVCGNQNVLMCPVSILPCTEIGITVTKNCVVSDCPNADGNFEVVCAIEIANSGTAPIVDLSVDDALAPIFGPFFVSGSITAFDNTAAPNVMQNAGYTGAGANGLVSGVAAGTPFLPGETVIVEVTALLGENSCGQQFVNDVDYSATDDCGRSLAGDASATIFVGDFEPPVARCVSSLTIGPGGAVFLTADEVDNGSSDNCGIVSRTLSTPGPFTCDQVGDFPVTLTVADACGNTDSCVATVTVVSCETFLSGFVFHDEECNRGQDTAEDPIPGVTVTLWTDPNCDGDFLDGSPIQTNITDNTGLFVFTGLVGGCFVVVQEDLPGWWSTADSGAPQNNPNAVAVTLSCCMNLDGVTFWDTRPETNYTDTVIEDCCETIILREWSCKNECDCDALICTQRIVLTNDVALEPCPIRGPFYLGCNPTLPVPDPGVFNTAGGCDITVEYSHFVDVTNGCLTTRTNFFNMSDACGNTQQCTEVWVWTDDLEPPLPTMLPSVTNTLECVCIGDPLPLPDPTNGLACADNCDGFAVVSISNMAMQVTNMSVSMQSLPVTNIIEVVTTNEIVTMVTTMVVDSVETNVNPAFSMLQINEVLSNPSGADGAGAATSGEFIELVGPPGMNIGCWVITDGDFIMTIPPGFVIPADGIVLIASSGYTGGPGEGACPANAGYTDIDIPVDTCGCFTPANQWILTNGGEHFGIYDAAGTFVSGLIFDGPSAGNSPAGDTSYPLTSPAIGACAGGLSIGPAPTANYVDTGALASNDDLSFQLTDNGYVTDCISPGSASGGQNVAVVMTNFVDVMIPVTNMMTVTANVENVVFTNVTVTNFTTNTVFTPVVITGAASCVIAHLGDVTNISPCEISVTRTWRFSDLCGNFVERGQVYLFPVNDKVGPECISGPTNLMLGCNPGGVDALMPTPSDYVFADTCGVQAVWISNQVTVADDCAFVRTLTIAAIDNCGNVTTKMTTVTWTEDLQPPTITNFPTSIDLGCNPSAADISDALDGFGAGGGGGGMVPVVPPWFNEFHYDNAGTDENECFEIAGQAGTSLAGWSIELVNGNGGTVYNTIPLTGTIPNTVNGYGALCFCQSGVQNGAPDGFVLVDPAGNAVWFLSYEGAFMATAGAANGMMSTDVGVSESSGTLATDSLQLVGSGTAYGDFTWAAPSASSCGSPNANQTFDTLTPVPTLSPTFGATDNCGICTQTLVCSTNTIDCITVIECIFTAVDCCGNVAQRESTITWQEDDLPPTFTCPTNQTLGCNPVIPAPNPAIITNATDEGCGLVEVQFVGDGITYQDCETVIERVYSAIDECGNVSSCTQTFTFISDQSPPEVVLIPADIELGCQVTRDDIPAPGDQMFLGVDNCNLVATNHVGDTETTQDCVIVILRVYEFVDECGNAKYGQQTIRFSENTVVAPPLCNDLPPLDLGCNPTPPIPDPGRMSPISDCGIVRVEFLRSENAEMGCMNILTNFYVATDVCGQVVTCQESFVWIEDLTPPQITGMPADSNSTVCIADKTNLPLPAPQTNEVVCVDECGTCTVAHAGDFTNLTPCEVIVERVYRVTDSCGQIAERSQFFSWPCDDESPPIFIDGPASADLGCNPDPADLVPAPSSLFTFLDPCGYTVAFVTSAVTTVGCTMSQDMEYVAMDSCGNTATQAIFWTWTEDSTPPVLTACPNPTNLGCVADAAAAMAAVTAIPPALTDIVGTDNCATVTVTFLADRVKVLGCGGTVTRQYLLTDDCGNSLQHDQLFHFNIDDGSGPDIQALPVLALGCIQTLADIPFPDATLVLASDFCPIGNATHVGDVTTGTDCDATIVRTYAVADLCGNTSTVEQTISYALDNTEPAITSAMPRNVDLGCITDLAVVPPANPGLITATDDCGVVAISNVLDITNNVAGTCRWSVDRTYHVVDACGNLMDYDEHIDFVLDTGAPVIDFAASMPTNVDLTPNCNPVIPAPNPAGVVATDDCGIDRVEFIGESRSLAGCESTITRIYVVTDGCGNSTNFVQTLNYYDDTTPPQVLIVPRNVNLGCAFDLLNLPPPSSNVNLTNDNCNVTQNGSTDYVSTQGCVVVVDRVYEFTDLCGNLAYGVQTFNFSTAATVAPPSCMDEPVHFLGCNPTVPPPDSSRVAPMSDCGIIKTVFSGSVQITNICVVTRTNFYESTDVCGQTVTCIESFIWTEDVTPPTVAAFPADEEILCVDATALPVPTADVALVVCADDCQELIVISNDITVTTQEMVNTEIVTMTNLVATTVVVDVVTTTGGMTNLITNTMDVVTTMTVTNVVTTNTEMVTTNLIPGVITEIEINEVLADASGTEGAGAGGVGGEFIEFIGPPGTDVSCFVFTDGDVVITIPDGTLIPADGILLFASSAYSDGMNGISNYAGLIDVDINTCGCITNTSGSDVWNLTNGGEHFGLYDSTGALVAGFIYGSPSAGNMIGGGNEYGGTVPALGACPGGFTITAGATNEYSSAPFTDGASNSDISYQLVSNGVYTTTFMTPGSATVGAPSSEVVTNTVTMSVTNIITVPVTNMVDVITTNITGGMTVTQQQMVATNVEVVTFDNVTTTNTIVTTNSNPVLGLGGAGCTVVHVGDVTSQFDCVSTVVRTYRIADGCGNWIEREQRFRFTHDDGSGPVLLSGPPSLDLGCNPNTVPAYNAADFVFEDQPCGVDTVWISRDELAATNPCALVREIEATARDLCGNTTTVTVVTRWSDDTTAPVIVCPADEDLGCFVDTPAVIPPAFTNAAEFTAAGGTLSDACGASLSLISEQALILPGCNEGLTRTYLAVDPCGNFQTCNQTFTWKASTTPVLTCPPSLDLGCNPAAADLPNAFDLARRISVSAACATVLSNVVDDLVFDGVCSFTHTFQFEATDECGNTSLSCPIVYDWRVDTKPPVVQTTQAGGFLGCTATVPAVDTNAVTATDEGCGVMMVRHEGDVTTAIGCFTTVRRTYRIMDQCGNFTDEIVTFTFSTDSAPPTVIQGVEPIVFACNPSSIPPANPTQIIATDDCGTPLVAHLADGIPLAGCVASLERLYSVSDDCGNVLIITQQIAYTLDQTPPVVSIAPANIDLGCNPAALPPAEDAINVISDGCKIIGTNITSTVTTNGCDVTMRRNYVFDDICSNAVIGLQILTWTIDTEAPVVDLAASRATNVFFGCNPGTIPGPNPFDVAVTDDCGDVAVTWIGDDNVLGDCAVMLNRRYLLEDACGNQSVHTQTFSYISDTLPPVIQVSPPSIELGCNIDPATIPAPMTDVTVASDSCQIVSTNWIGDSAPVTDGCDVTITRTYEFEDFCGNTKTATQLIRYSESSTPPVLAVPNDRELGCNPPAADIPSLFEIVSAAVVQVDCGSGSVTGTMAETTSGCLHTRTFEVTASDDCGLQTTETVVYTWSDDSDLPLVTSGPTGADLGCNPDSIPAPDTSLVIAIDDCGATVSHVGDTTSTNDCDVTMRRRYAIVDDCGNRALHDVIYTWTESSQDPGINIQPALDLGCAPDTGDIPTRADVLALAIVDSECVPATLDATMTAVTNSCLVMHTWTITSMDECGRNGTATFVARWLQDSAPPTITSRAPDASLGCNPAGGGAPAPNLASIVATDDCGTVNISHLGDEETIDGCEHTLKRTYRATDLCGNNTDQVITYTWTEDTDPPVLNCPATLEIQAFDECLALAPDLAAQFQPADPCGQLTLRQTPAPGTALDGNDTHSITLTAIDGCGNESSCSVPLTIICMPEIELLKTVVAGHDAACPGVEVVDGFMGEPVTFCFEVINVGRVNLENVVVDDPLIGAGISIPIGDLAVGESKTASANGEVSGITNVATVVGAAVNSGIGVSDADDAYTQSPCGCAAGAVFIDLSNDGTPSNDNLENVGIAGVTVNIYEVNDDGTETFIANTTTGPNGMYQYTLPSGNYRTELDSSTVPGINTAPGGDENPSQTFSISMCECTPDDLDGAPNFAIAPSPTAAKLTGASATGGVLAWSTSAEVDVLGYNVIDAASGQQVNEALILAVGGAGDYEIEVGPGEYIVQEVSGDLATTETTRLTHYDEVDAKPVGEPTRIVAETPFVTSEGVASYLVTGIAAGEQAFDVTRPEAPVRLLSERLETSAGQGLYFSYPAGATIEVRQP